MADIDLIPAAYRARWRVLGTLRRFALAGAALLLLGLIALGMLRWRIAVMTPQLAQLRISTARGEAARTAFQNNTVQKHALMQDAATLASLRGSGEVARVTGAIDHALNPAVWFRDLTFTREQQLLLPGAPAAEHTGYLIILPATTSSTAVTPEQTWRLTKHIEINGSATDHAALTQFLQRLGQQSSIAEVHFIRSNVHASADERSIDFDVIAATQGPAKASP